MPIQPAEWLVPKRVIIAHATGQGTREEFHQHNQRMLTLLDDGESPVHVILRNDHFRPPTPSLSQGMAMLSFLRHKRLGWNIMVADDTVSTNYASVLLARLLRVKYQRFTRVGDALDFLKNTDKSVAWGTMNESLLSWE